MPRQRDHRRQQHHAVEPAHARHAPRAAASVAPMEWASAKCGGGQSGSTTSLMKVSRSIWYCEIAHVAFARIAQRAVRHSLPAPVERGDGEAARAQVAHGLEIFLDELGAALEQADRALAARRRRPARKAQIHPVGRLEGSRDDVSGTGLAGMETRVMSCGKARARTPYSRARAALNRAIVPERLAGMPAPDPCTVKNHMIASS